MTDAHLAIDLGASSGRAIIGFLKGKAKKLELTELHRFVHLPCELPIGPVWDLTGIWRNVVQSLHLAAQWCQENKCNLVSIGVDTWGVDWVLLDESGELLGSAHCYRDPQNIPAAERVLETVGGKQALYHRNGIQHMPINTIYQLAARFHTSPELFAAADRLLFIPDLLHFWLSGQTSNERTIASTSGLLSVTTGQWDAELIEQLKLPPKIFGKLIEPGTVIGNILPDLAQATGLGEDVKIIAPGSHDTASAVAAVPFAPGNDNEEGPEKSLSAYLSSGTWSLLGAELKESFVSPESCEAPFTNERGLEDTVRFLKNIAGLWLVQELRREFEEQGKEVTFAELTDQARLADPFRTLIDPAAPQFAAPRAMAEKIRTFARQTDQPEPETMGDLVRCCLDSLALSYRAAVEQLESILGRQVEVLHIVGGGVNNRLLSEITCGVMNRKVICGPVEATAVGNLLAQAIGTESLKDLAELREVVGKSFEVETLLPEDIGAELRATEEIWQRYNELLGVHHSS